ncbi:MAG: peptide chain release factor N(5)-glutamine methyltransferase [Sphingomonadales bacterium]|nr:peptide chain release factor N(5)-glutamine methyltransferase [Sphingomonadales bacterium]MBD3772984.1 peptide chain release factor N(5)-glutamine methyltransferase [Paracoccaceae bacterium]
MTVGEAIREAAARLSATSDTARLDAEVLMAHALGVARSEMLLRHQREPVPDGFASLVERRAAHEPVAYITGTQEFYGLELRVTPEVLIPRGDSEVLVETALGHAAAQAGRVLDCGTGSGALLLAVLAARPGWQGIGIDISPGALAVAADNAARIALADRAQMVLASWCDSGWSAGLGRFDLILANPPYVEDAADLDPCVREYEPAGALFAGPEGLDDYRILIPQLRGLLVPGGLALLEIGASQGESVGALARDAGFSVDLRRDLAGRPRVICLT